MSGPKHAHDSEEPKKSIPKAPIQAHAASAEVIRAAHAANGSRPSGPMQPEWLDAFIPKPSAFECWREELESEICEHLEDEEEQRLLLESVKTAWADALTSAAAIAELKDAEGASHQAQKEAEFLWGKLKPLSPLDGEYASVRGQVASKLAQVAALKARVEALKG